MQICALRSRSGFETRPYYSEAYQRYYLAERTRELTVETVNRLPAKILVATRNVGKVREIKALLTGLPIAVLSLADVTAPPEVIEDGATFEENALKKARLTARATRMTVIADDSGLCIDALDGKPGVLSARYGGEDLTDEEKCIRILEEMRPVPEAKRTARFVCVLAVVSSDGKERLFRGVCEGLITRELRGAAGFGYDPIFYHEESGCTFAQMDRDQKNRVSHRGAALRAFAAYLNARKGIQD
jgi:XTP/dITP diphosphohydrolase